jgi:hypothetical protein
MKAGTIKKYSFNCFLLMLPIISWNLVLTQKLPKNFQSEVFWNNIPAVLMYGENISRIIVFLLTFLMPLSVSTPKQKKGIFLYTGGTVLYFTSWLILINFPNSAWSNSVWGFMAPSFIPLLWLTGIALTGNSFYFNLPYRRWIFVAISLVFLIFHNLHTSIVYCRANQIAANK